MSRASMMVGILLAGTLAAGAQTNVVIQSFGPPGQITFSKVTNASHYRVEWSSSAGTSWTNFAAAAAALDGFVSLGLGVVTASVPMLYRVVATDGPRGMALIPTGNFVMGDATNALPLDGGTFERPQHTVNVSAFYMDRYEVTKALWEEVKAHTGAVSFIYSSIPDDGKPTNYPVAVIWYNAAKWCNARSQRDGLTPVYYTDGDFKILYRSGDVAPFANWEANGYRLPTEAEWEKAARGGTAYTRFPWTDYTNNISWGKANYYGFSNSYSYDLSGGSGGYHPAFSNAVPYTSPVGYFAPNGYGLHDMAGNVSEWCWDWWRADYYANSPTRDPRGPGPTVDRVVRGGAWNDVAPYVRVAARDFSQTYSGNGFRCVRGL